MYRFRRSIQVGVMSLALTLVLSGPMQAQRIRVGDAWMQVYDQLPTLPKENQYVDRETKQVDQDNTFVGRLISYHIYVKGRPQSLRLDWKHTIADYLGVNEVIDRDTYPTQKRLQANPLEADRAVMRKLDRRQRDQLIQVLIAVLDPQIQQPPAVEPVSEPTASPSPMPVIAPPRTAPQPGGAALLK